MKKPQFNLAFVFVFFVIALVSGCKKEDKKPVTPPVVTYTNLSDFFAANNVKSEIFKIDAEAGGSFVTQKGTKVTIGPNTFVDGTNLPASGPVSIEFKDIYAKSDMLLGQMPVMLGNGAPLKSAGEFFIKATIEGNPLNLAKNKGIKVEQPNKDKVADSAMRPFVFGKGAGGQGWNQAGDSFSGLDTIKFLSNSYMFSLYKFSTPIGNGTWCNSDNAGYFSAYPQTVLTINTDFKDSAYNLNIYLVFKGVNSMVHVYDNGSNVFPYNYAPTGLQCTVVAIGVKNSKLYASYDDITITTNKTIKVTPLETNKDDFIAKIKSLD
jgi:hypothetical protein